MLQEERQNMQTETAQEMPSKNKMLDKAKPIMSKKVFSLQQTKSNEQATWKL